MSDQKVYLNMNQVAKRYHAPKSVVWRWVNLGHLKRDASMVDGAPIFLLETCDEEVPSLIRAGKRGRR